MEHIALRDLNLMRLLDGEWLETDLTSVYLKLLVREIPRFQIIASLTIAWNLTDVNRPGGPNPDIFPNFVIEDNATSLIIPHHVRTCHWMLCVCILPNINQQDDILKYYNSLYSAY